MMNKNLKAVCLCYIRELNIKNLKIYTSYSQRSIQTVEYLGVTRKHWKTWNEIPTAMNEEMSYDEIKNFCQKRGTKIQKLETYENLVATTIESLIMQLERRRKIFNCIRSSSLNCRLTYYVDKESFFLEVSLHNVIKLTSAPYGWNVEKLLPQMILNLKPSYIELSSLFKSEVQNRSF